MVQGTDGNNYEITKDMVEIFMKTEKTSSKYFKTQAPLIPLYWKIRDINSFIFYISNQLNLAEVLKRHESLACYISIPQYFVI